VANALAEAREQFRITAQETHARIESLQLELNLDAVTRLPNRKYFFNELRRALNALVPPHRLPQQGTEAGYVVMFRQRDLAAINRYMPRDFTDQWLRSVARRLEQKVGGQHNPPFLLARLNGSDFALLLRDIPQEQALLHAEALRHELHTLRVCLDDQTWCRWALAIAPYWSGDHVSELLATLDHTLMRAESADTNAVLQAEKSAMGEAPGEHQWHDTLMMALEQHRFSLSTHAIENSAGVVLHYEGSLMLHEAKHCPPIHAQRFMPAAVRLGISSECDIQAVRLALDWLVSYTGKLAVPITLASLEQSNFASRLGQMLRDRPAQAGRLALEINAHDIIENFTPIRTLCEVVREAGSCIGLCQLAQDFNAMTKLHQLPLAYVKLGAAFVPSLPHSLGSRHLARCVMDTAHALKIAVYAEDANNETCKFLEDMGIMPVYPRTTLNRPLRCLHEP
jgi:predicted signal transduction protein with EAL and GGDEF domain